MAEAKNKTKPTGASVEQFLEGVKSDAQRADAHALVDLMRDVTGAAPFMWGPSIIGFGLMRFRHDSGREGDTVTVGFAPRAGKFALYGVTGPDGASELLARLGRHDAGASCLYVKRLSDVDMDVLRELVELAWATRSSDPDVSPG